MEVLYAEVACFDNSEKQERVNVYDENAVKQILDDWVRKIVLRKYPAEDFTVANYKILFGGISCLLGVYAHYGVGPWPGSRNALIFCVLAFVVLQLVLRYIATNMEKDFILSTNPHQGKTFRVRTGFSKDTGTYEVEFVDRKSEATGSPKTYKSTKPITEYFDKQGLFYGNILELHVIEALDKFLAKATPE